mmetsp:Transcript_39478/g.37922  ORF Transcript_39478/g.37922 Transcript_39478/m.37922 type:complete len:88 (+) Transcript_39478:859-1122(+)
MGAEISTNIKMEASVITNDNKQYIQDIEEEEGKSGDYQIRMGGDGGTMQSSPTKIVDTMGVKIKDTVALVCLGDSRGFIHMNHLILK